MSIPGRASIALSISVSLLIHALGLWLLLRQPELKLGQPPAHEEKRLTISLAPPVARTAPPPSTPASIAPKAEKPAPRHKTPRKPVPEIRRAPVIVQKPPPSPQDNSQPQLSSADDMFAQLEAARKRRAEARTKAGLPPAETSSAKSGQANGDNSVALANIASAVRQGKQRDADSGGIFQIRHLGYHDAAFLFRGWSTSANRDRTRLIEVQQGSHRDIQSAVVKKMIEIIREERNGDFIWESHRLGREVSLSARPQDEARLQQFLLQEFFPDYTPRNPAG